MVTYMLAITRKNFYLLLRVAIRARIQTKCYKHEVDEA